MKKPIIVLTGPTAVGKTEISIELAKAAGGEIISADSMQVYKQMDIGTAKIKKEQMQGVTHYMIDEWNPDEEFNVMIFQKRVKEIMEDIYNRGKIPILVGGTGFYIQAVLNDIAFTKEKQGDEIRADLQNLAKEKGAFWDKDNKTWFVPDYKDINLFSQWIDTDKVSIIAKAPFWIGVTQKTCWKCGSMIDVIAFASNKFWIYEYSDDDEALQEWYLQDYFSFFYMPGYIEKEILDIVCSRFPTFKLGFSKTVNGKYWANHCEHCNALQGDFFMHNEPGGEFSPIDMDGYKAITLIEFPYKFDLPITASYSWASNEKDILRYCPKTQW